MYNICQYKSIFCVFFTIEQIKNRRKHYWNMLFPVLHHLVPMIIKP